MQSDVNIRLNHQECKFLKSVLLMIADENINDVENGGFTILALCSTLNRRIDDAMKGDDR